MEWNVLDSRSNKLRSSGVSMSELNVLAPRILNTLNYGAAILERKH